MHLNKQASFTISYFIFCAQAVKQLVLLLYIFWLTTDGNKFAYRKMKIHTMSRIVYSVNQNIFEKTTISSHHLISVNGKRATGLYGDSSCHSIFDVLYKRNKVQQFSKTLRASKLKLVGLQGNCSINRKVFIKCKQTSSWFTEISPHDGSHESFHILLWN